MLTCPKDFYESFNGVWNDIRGDICEISLFLNNAFCSLASCQLSLEQEEKRRTKIKKYGIQKIANQMHHSSNKEEAAQEIAKRVIEQWNFGLWQMLGLLFVFVVCGLFFLT